MPKRPSKPDINQIAASIVSPLSAPRPFVEDGAKSLAVKSHAKSVFLRELGDLCFTILRMHRPEAFQFILVNGAVLPIANLQLAFDSVRERFHPLRKCLGATDFGQEIAFLSILF